VGFKNETCRFKLLISTKQSPISVVNRSDT
jgi:hypothetical protein